MVRGFLIASSIGLAAIVAGSAGMYYHSRNLAKASAEMGDRTIQYQRQDGMVDTVTTYDHLGKVTKANLSSRERDNFASNVSGAIAFGGLLLLYGALQERKNRRLG